MYRTFKKIASAVIVSSLILTAPGQGFYHAWAQQAKPSKVVIPVFTIPGYVSPSDKNFKPDFILLPDNTFLPVKPGDDLSQPSVPAQARKAAPALEQLDEVVQLSEDAELTLSQSGDISLEVKEKGDKAFDLRETIMEWHEVAAYMLSSVKSKSLPANKKAVERAFRRGLREVQEKGIPNVKLSPQASAHISGFHYLLNLAAKQAHSWDQFVDLFSGMLVGYSKALSSLYFRKLDTVLKEISLPAKTIINDVTQLNPIAVERVAAPETVEEIAEAVKNHPGPVSIGGGRYSMGGQTATEGSLFLDMKGFDKVLEFFPEKKLITVQSGISWRQIQDFIDPHNLSLRIMQSYSNFSVGGSLSVNVHGRYVGQGPLILSVKSIKVVLADGSVVKASPEQNPEIFYGAIGGYGALGVIAEATLELAENKRVKRETETVPAARYKKYFFEKIRNSSKAVFHNADLSDPDDTTARSVTWFETEEPVTVEERLMSRSQNSRLRQFIIRLLSGSPWARKLRDRFGEPLFYLGNRVVWRNHEASYDVSALEPSSRKKSTYVLQEYFVPVDRLDEFLPKMNDILKRYRVNSLNVSIRHAKKDPGSMLAWAREEVFAFVLYHQQGTGDFEKAEVGVWTRELIDAVLSVEGSYYLPYQIHATPEQFQKAYPRAEEFFALKKKLDPQNKFRNKLWDAYYPENRTQAESPAPSLAQSHFKTVFSAVGLRDGFYRFLQNIYRLYPENRFHHLIAEMTSRYSTDEEIYKGIQKRLPKIKPFLGQLTYALPSLWKQKKEMAEETARLLGPKIGPIRGYVEIGTTGRYVNELKKRLGIEGPVYVINDQAPSYSPADIFERGQISKIGTYLPLYEPIDREIIPDESVDLVTVYIGLHHSPRKKLDAFVRSIHRILRPGGKLVIRDHDVNSPEMDAFVHLAHDVYNAGLGLSWDENRSEIRHFTSVKVLEDYLGARGFKSSGKKILQDNDPTINTLMEFVKEGRVPTSDLEGYKRDEALTYLSLPEWTIVYSAREYGAFLQKNPPSGFPYFGSVAQYWRNYLQVSKIAKEKYPFSLGAHVMLFVIGASFSAENLIKGLYENTAGRMTEWLSSPELTEEDKYAKNVALEYARFLDHTPWYEFPFAQKLKGLWSGTSLLGPDLLRKWERKIVLSLEYGVKAAYGWLIQEATKSAYGSAELKTMLRTGEIPEAVLKKEPEIKVVKKMEDGTLIIEVPRYQAFTQIASMLAKENIRFIEIAGNDEILVTILAPRGWQYDFSEGGLLFAEDILTDPDLKRIAVRVPVRVLSEVLGELEESVARIEHVYDY